MMLKPRGLESAADTDTFPGECASGAHALKCTFMHSSRPFREPQEAQGPGLGALACCGLIVSGITEDGDEGEE